MASGIKVSTQVLVDTADKITSINETLTMKLESINKEMDNLETTWQSRASSDIRAAMNALKPRFDEYRGVVADYAKFLRQTADAYVATEDMAVKNVNSVQFK